MPSKCLVAVEARINRIPIDKDSLLCYRLHDFTMKFLADRSDKECSREKRHLAILSGLRNYSLEEGQPGYISC